MPPLPLGRTVYTGTLIDTPKLGKLRVRQHAIVGVDEHGRIAFLEEYDEEGIEEELVVRRLVMGWGWGWQGFGSRWNWVRGEKGGWWFPGFVGKEASLFFFWVVVVGSCCCCFCFCCCCYCCCCQ